MSNPNDKDTQNQSKPSKAFDAYAVRQGRDGKGHFHKIGAAFPHKDGQGYDLDLVAAPTNGRVTLRTPKDRLDDMRQQEETERQTDEKEHWANRGKGKSNRSRRRDQVRDR